MTFDNYCRVVWAAGDGRHKKALKTINEEVAEYGSTGRVKQRVILVNYCGSRALTVSTQ
ncbi:hypothetical protein PE36_15914 [Moritella sp. PE36]|uniref:hypothetical protein n=1 Tax=Moritella sp. PE36 TaxID=58051 RepID=UPI0001568479|nr:hypothetical protein [Moritella sp. PE36]EDM68298.1 hypothetical protein PE36_15914 [Moritella sp. PE36]